MIWDVFIGSILVARLLFSSLPFQQGPWPSCKVLAHWTLGFSFIYDACLRDNDDIWEFTKWQFSLPFLSLVYFTQCNPIKGEANWSLASFLLSLAKKSITSSPELQRLLSACISVSTGFAGLERIDGNMFNSILIFFIFCKMETTSWSYIMTKGRGPHGNCFLRKLGVFWGVLVCSWECAWFSDSFVWCGSHSGNQVVIVQCKTAVSPQTLGCLLGHIKSNPTGGGKERVYQWTKCQRALITYNIVSDVK